MKAFAKWSAFPLVLVVLWLSTSKAAHHSENPTVVFFGDSQISRWDLAASFPGKHFINKGTPGQDARRLLFRFRRDVLALNPDEMVLLIGTNDIYSRSGRKLAESRAEIELMVLLAKHRGITPVLCTVPPMRYKDLNPAVREFNSWLKSYASAHSIQVLDYYSALADSEGNLPPELAVDSVHLNQSGYAKLAGLLTGIPGY